MSDEKSGRKILWWSLPISPDDKAEVGRRMMRSTLGWFIVVLVVVVVVLIVR